jgi:hypothetical protein
MIDKTQAWHTEIVYKLTLFCCCYFANKSKISTMKKWQQKHWFVYELYGFCCCAYQSKQNKIVIFFCYAWALMIGHKHTFLTNVMSTNFSPIILLLLFFYINFLLNSPTNIHRHPFC